MSTTGSNPTNWVFRRFCGCPRYALNLFHQKCGRAVFRGTIHLFKLPVLVDRHKDEHGQRLGQATGRRRLFSGEKLNLLWALVVHASSAGSVQCPVMAVVLRTTLKGLFALWPISVDLILSMCTIELSC